MGRKIDKSYNRDRRIRSELNVKRKPQTQNSKKVKVDEQKQSFPIRGKHFDISPNIKCYNYKKNHYRSQCRVNSVEVKATKNAQIKKNGEKKTSQNGNFEIRNLLIEQVVDERPYVNISCENMQFKCLVDSDATSNFISPTIIQRVSLEVHPVKEF